MNISTHCVSRLGLLSLFALGPSAPSVTDPCDHSAHQTWQACRKEALADLWLQRAKCTNLPTLSERIQCTLEAMSDFQDTFKECGEQRVARLDLCARLGGGIYHPEIDPDDFVRGIDNPYLPFVPGTTFVYEKEDDEGLERIEVTVTDETKEILGVNCTVVRDVVSVDGEVVEDTLDWFAQDVAGNVWYFGEISQEFEDGELVGIEGSWQAGVDGAQPGILMQAAPQVGDVYRQEFLIGEAEDAAAVLSLSESVDVEYGSFAGCLQTEEFSPLSPGGLEHKYYAPGVGLLLEVNVHSGTRTELIEILR